MAQTNIGSPLIPTERPAEQPRVLARQQAGGVGQISTAVAVQKVPMISGTELAKANQARVDLYSEVANIGVTVGKAGAYMYEQQELKKKLDYESKYNELYINSKRDFNIAQTAQDKEAVRNTYEANVTKLNVGVKSQQWNSVKEQAWSQGLVVESKKNLADFTAKFRVAEFNETVTDANAKLKLNAESFRTQENIDPFLKIDQGTEILESLYRIGAISKAELLLKLEQYTKKATLDRANLIATNYASTMDVNTIPKTPEELLAALQQRLLLPIDSSNVSDINETFKTAFMEEFARKNKLNSFREKYIGIAFKEENAEINAQLSEKIADGTIIPEDFKDAETTARLHGDKEQLRKIRALKSNWNNNTQVNPKISAYWTTIGGEGYDYVFSKKHGFMDKGGLIRVTDAMDYIRKQHESGEPAHDGFTRDERTLTSIESAFRKYNLTVKNKKVTDIRVNGHIRDFLFRTLEDGIRGGNAQAVKTQLLNLLNVSPDTLKQSMRNMYSMPDAWITNLVKHNDKYNSITQGLTDEIKNLIATTDVRDGDGVYSTKGFSQDSVAWNKQFRDDVIDRFRKHMGLDTSQIADHKPSVKKTGETLALVRKKPDSTQPMPDNDEKANAQKIIKTQNEIKEKTDNQVNPTVETVAEKLQENKGNTEKTVKDITSDYQPTQTKRKVSPPLNLGLEDFEDEDVEPTETSTVVPVEETVNKSMLSYQIKNLKSQFDMVGDAWNWEIGELSNLWNWEVRELSKFFSESSIKRYRETVKPYLNFSNKFELGARFVTAPLQIAQAYDELGKLVAGDSASFDMPLVSDEAQNKQLTASAKQKLKTSGVMDVPENVDKGIQIMSNIGAKVHKEMNKARLVLQSGTKWAGSQRPYPKGNMLGMEFGDKPKKKEPIIESGKENMSAIGQAIGSLGDDEFKKQVQRFDTVPIWELLGIERGAVKEFVKPVVEEVTQAIREETATPVPEQPMTDEQTLDWLEKKLRTKERKRLRKIKDTKAQHTQKDEKPLDFNNQKKIERWVALYNKRVDGKLTAKETKELNKLEKYLNSRGLLPQG